MCVCVKGWEGDRCETSRCGIPGLRPTSLAHSFSCQCSPFGLLLDGSCNFNNPYICGTHGSLGLSGDSKSVACVCRDGWRGTFCDTHPCTNPTRHEYINGVCGAPLRVLPQRLLG